VGISALSSVTSGYGDTAFGADALWFDTTGYYNTAVGIEALVDNTTGDYNTAEGAFSLLSNTNGSYNTAVGAFALDANRSGSYNTALGYESLVSNTTGSNNTAVGYFAGYFINTGGNNVLLGQSAGNTITTGSGNLAIGVGAGTAISTGNNNIDIGNAGFGNESGVIRIGNQGVHTKAVFNGIYGNPISSSSGIVCVNSSGLIGTIAGGGAVLTGDLQFDTSAYRSLSMSGGNSIGYLYGQYNAFGGEDGVYLGYNFYYDGNGTAHIPDTGGGTSRLAVGFSDISLFVGGVNAAPTTLRLDATSSGVTVYGTFNNSSDRNAKQDFAPVSAANILDKVLQLPLSEWSYKTDASTRHIGPMGQDFYSTFKIGTDEKHIAPIDEGGVALAAIQGLNQKLEQKDTELQALKQRLEKLEQLLEQKDRGEK
jgi:hypothetical protein